MTIFWTDPELRRTLWSLVAFPKLKRQLLLMDPVGLAPKDFSENTLFWINQEFSIIKNAKLQRRGKVKCEEKDKKIRALNCDGPLFVTDKPNRSTSIEHRTIATRRQSIHCTVTYFTDSRGNYQNYENEETAQQCITSGIKKILHFANRRYNDI